MGDEADVPDNAADAERQLVAEHINDIMFTSYESPDPECHLCKLGITLGAWAHYGVDDPFADDDDAARD